jgi:hypothetical protein
MRGIDSHRIVMAAELAAERLAHQPAPARGAKAKDEARPRAPTKARRSGLRMESPGEGLEAPSSYRY